MKLSNESYFSLNFMVSVEGSEKNRILQLTNIARPRM